MTSSGSHLEAAIADIQAQSVTVPKLLASLYEKLCAVEQKQNADSTRISNLESKLTSLDVSFNQFFYDVFGHARPASLTVSGAQESAPPPAQVAEAKNGDDTTPQPIADPQAIDAGTALPDNDEGVNVEAKEGNATPLSLIDRVKNSERQLRMMSDSIETVRVANSIVINT